MPSEEVIVVSGMPPIRDMIVGFVDIRHFFRGTFGHAPGEIYAFLSAFYERVLPIAEQYGGRLVKTIGDAALIVWEPTDATRALEAAGRMRREFEQLRECFEDRANMRLAVALAMGPVVAGEMGPPSIRRFDVVGEAANQAARQLRRGEVVISKAVVRAAGGADSEDVVVVRDER